MTVSRSGKEYRLGVRFPMMNGLNLKATYLEEKIMSKKNYRKSPIEKQQHDTAVKVRKMTDEQLCGFLDEISAQQNNLESFFDKLNKLKGTGNGISTGTIYKLRKIAVEYGFIMEEKE